MNTPRLSDLSLAVAIGLLSTSAWSSNGHIITVDTLADGSLPDACTLRDALRASASAAAQGGCAAGQPGQDEILITASGTLALTQGALGIDADVIITGPGVEALAIDGGGQSRIFAVDGTGFNGQAGNVVITDMTLFNVGPSTFGGGAIFLEDVDQTVIERVVIRDGLRGGIRAEWSGNLRLVDTVIENTGWVAISVDLGEGLLELDQVSLLGNSSGLYCNCELQMADSVVTGNQGTFNAGGIETYLARVNITDSVISGNSSGNVGGLQLGTYELNLQRVTIAGNSGALAGGLLVRPLSEARIEQVSIHGNQASGLGNRGVGGMLVNTRPLSSLELVNSTISGNAGTRAGGIDFDDTAGGSSSFEHLTITANTTAESTDAIAGGVSVRLDQVQLSFANSIVADNQAGQGVADDLVAWTRDSPQDPIVPGASLPMAYSLIEDADGFVAAGSGNLLDQSAELGPLADNGGPTLTHAPLPGSPVLNAGDPDFEPPPALDQRGPGFPRVLGGRLDMGAVEADFDQIFVDRFQLP